MKRISERSPGSISLPSGTTHIPFEQIELLIARAIEPDGTALARFKVAMRVGPELVNAVREGRLQVRDPLTGGLLSPDAPWHLVETSEVSVADLRAYSAQMNVKVGEASAVIERPVKVHRLQEEEILAAIGVLGYEPTALPMQKPGRLGVKSEVRKLLGKQGHWAGSTVLDKAWDRLLSDGGIRYTSRSR